jgi:YVTN family beta-propeller protein
MSGGGEVDPSSRTNGAGIATVAWRVGGAAGSTARVLAILLDTLTGALIDTAVFNATIVAGPAAQIVAQTPTAPFLVAAGQAQPVTLRARVFDAFGNGVRGATVSWVRRTGGGNLSTATSTTGADGVATNAFTVSTIEQETIIDATTSGVTAVASFVLQTRQITVRAATLSGGAFGIARTPAGQLLVSLINQGEVERVTVGSQSSLRAIVGGTPVVIAADNNGQFAYVANMGTGTLGIVDIATMTLVAQVDVPGDAHALALSPRGDRVYVTNTHNAVFGVDVTSRTVVSTSSVPNGPWGIAFWTTATDSLMYVTARDGGSITEIDMRTGAFLRTLNAPGRPHGLAIAPNGSTLYAADDANGDVVFVDRATGITTRRVGVPGAFGIAITPDGRTLFVTTNTGKIAVIDIPSGTVTKTESTEGQPRQILVLPDGNTALAANAGGWIDQVTR